MEQISLVVPKEKRERATERMVLVPLARASMVQ
jgi:hypothetical protein